MTVLFMIISWLGVPLYQKRKLSGGSSLLICGNISIFMTKEDTELIQLYKTKGMFSFV